MYTSTEWDILWISSLFFVSRFFFFFAFPLDNFPPEVNINKRVNLHMVMLWTIHVQLDAAMVAGIDGKHITDKVDTIDAEFDDKILFQRRRE